MAYPVVADGGELTVLRSLASFAYGAWSVEWPDTVPEENQPTLPDDREFGFASRLREEPGRMGRMFVRSDVSISAAEHTPGGEVVAYSGRSDVEQVLDEAAERTDGDVFFEQDVGPEGLGGLIPFVDFNVGDPWRLAIFGKLVDTVVARIEATSQVGDSQGWRVGFGAELLGDSDARERAIRDLKGDIAQERRERTKDVATVSAAASSAQSTADTARDEVAVVRDTLAGEQSGEPDLVSQLVAVNEELQRLGAESQPSLMLAFVELSTKLWEAQQEIDAVQTTAIADNEARIGELETLTDELVKTQQELVARRIPVLSDGNDGQYFSREGATVTARDEWSGDVQVLEDDVGPRAVRIPTLEGGRTISLENADSWVTLLALVSQGVMRRFVGGLSTSLPLASVSWGYVAGSPSFTASMTGEHTIRAKVEWERAIYFATYGLRIVVGGSVVKTIEQSKIGPLIGNAVRSQMLTVSDVVVNAGQKIELQVKADTGEGPAKWVRSLTVDVVWVEGA